MPDGALMPFSVDLPVIHPDWDAPTSVVAFTTTTAGGISQGDCTSFNLGAHVGDHPEHVAENRRRLQSAVGENVQLCWLQQTHSDIIIHTNNYTGVVEGDAAVSTQRHRACVIMTADCLPVLLCNREGNRVAALHCGWRGLAHNLIGKTLTRHFPNDNVIAWLGPAIGQPSYEVDTALYQRFVAIDSAFSSAFLANRPQHYLMNLYAVARLQLRQSGVAHNAIFGGDFDTFSDARCFSHRRSAASGRMASVIFWR